MAFCKTTRKLGSAQCIGQPILVTYKVHIRPVWSQADVSEARTLFWRILILLYHILKLQPKTFSHPTRGFGLPIDHVHSAERRGLWYFCVTFLCYPGRIRWATQGGHCSFYHKPLIIHAAPMGWGVCCLLLLLLFKDILLEIFVFSVLLISSVCFPVFMCEICIINFSNCLFISRLC